MSSEIFGGEGIKLPFYQNNVIIYPEVEANFAPAGPNGEDLAMGRSQGPATFECI